MEQYDVIVVGAGPAGGQCARDLSESGAKVLLIEKAKHFHVNNYSSAGAPSEILTEFQLPESICSHQWHTLEMHSSLGEYKWQSTDYKGVVLDFAKLRSFLADEVTNTGGQFLPGVAYLGHQEEEGSLTVSLKTIATGAHWDCRCRALVDATGCERQLLGQPYDKENAVVATGIEHLIEVPEKIYRKYAHSLSFYLGRKWMPQGYAWIFPMEENSLKIGVGRYFQDEVIVPHNPSYAFYLNQFKLQTVGREDYPILDKHGKTLTYTYGQKDPRYSGGVVAIGDAISSVNPLAFEGIRHAMASGSIASKHVLRYLKGKERDFSPYAKEMDRYFGWRWKISEKMMHFIYREPNEHKVDLMLRAFQEFSFSEMLELCFHYRFKLAARFFLNYWKQKFSSRP